MVSAALTAAKQQPELPLLTAVAAAAAAAMAATVLRPR
jgi:hypothetical protein